MVPYRHPVEQVLLPYEKRLIAALGCSEQEYKEFVREVERRYCERPKEYERIPNVVALAEGQLTLLLINIAVSAIFTAASILLCLLYTSPSPRDRQKSRMPSSA